MYSEPDPALAMLAPPVTRALSRRAMLQFTVRGALAGSALATVLLEACASPSPAAPTTGSAAAAPTSAAPKPAATTPGAGATGVATAAGASSRLQLPAHVAFAGPPADYPASPDGTLPAAYNTWPTQLTQTVTGPVGSGGEVTFFTYNNQQPPPDPGKNPTWTQLNRALGVDFKDNGSVPYVDYRAKLPAIIASDSLPDLLTIGVNNELLPNQTQFLNAKCADLTPFVSGDAIKSYPNLANYPTDVWKAATFGGKLFGVPNIYNSIGLVMMTSQNTLDQLGVTGFKNAAEFQSALKQVNSPGTRWALGVINADQVGVHWFSAMFGAPNNWRNDGGKFTKDYETPEYKAAVAYVRGLWDQGLIHPDTPGQAQNVAYDNFERGKTVFAPGLWTPFRLIWDDLGPGLGIDPNFKLRGLTPFGHDGGKGASFIGSGNFALTVFKKASAERVQELLRIMNYLTSPFGSQEYLTTRFGVKGVDYNSDETGNPIYTPLGQTEAYRQPWWSLPGPPDVIYYPRSADFAKIVYPLEAASYAVGVRDPSIGLDSETLATKGALLTKAVLDGVNQIIYGRAPIDSFDQVVSDWKNNGGDKIRAELQQAVQTAA